jgi:hypothetical protein
LPVEDYYYIWGPADIPYRLSLACLARLIGIARLRQKGGKSHPGERLALDQMNAVQQHILAPRGPREVLYERWTGFSERTMRRRR